MASAGWAVKEGNYSLLKVIVTHDNKSISFLAIMFHMVAGFDPVKNCLFFYSLRNLTKDIGCS